MQFFPFIPHFPTITAGRINAPGLAPPTQQLNLLSLLVLAHCSDRHSVSISGRRILPMHQFSIRMEEFYIQFDRLRFFRQDVVNKLGKQIVNVGSVKRSPKIPHKHQRTIHIDKFHPFYIDPPFLCRNSFFLLPFFFRLPQQINLIAGGIGIPAQRMSSQIMLIIL